jgi:hypothetical protein
MKFTAVTTPLLLLLPILEHCNSFIPAPRACSWHSHRHRLFSEASPSEPSSTPSEASTQQQEQIKPDILEPFLPAADPKYAVRGPVGRGDFVLSRGGEPTIEELSNENLLKILMIECSDLEVRKKTNYSTCIMCKQNLILSCVFFTV